MSIEGGLIFRKICVFLVQIVIRNYSQKLYICKNYCNYLMDVVFKFPIYSLVPKNSFN